MLFWFDVDRLHYYGHVMLKLGQLHIYLNLAYLRLVLVMLFCCWTPALLWCCLMFKNNFLSYGYVSIVFTKCWSWLVILQVRFYKMTKKRDFLNGYGLKVIASVMFGFYHTCLIYWRDIISNWLFSHIIFFTFLSESSNIFCAC
jgi:hypothetical protein